MSKIIEKSKGSNYKQIIVESRFLLFWRKRSVYRLYNHEDYTRIFKVRDIGRDRMPDLRETGAFESMSVRSLFYTVDWSQI